MNLSVVICTHDPNKSYLKRTLEALKSQNLSLDQWDLLLIDNLSNPPLSKTLDLSWHPSARIIVEEELGILPARVRGISETSTPLILFVDDDNIIAPDYLIQSLEISKTHPFLGCWGGSITPEFESPPPSWIGDFLPLLACSSVVEDCWSNLKVINITTPPTAGMCLRREVGDAFVHMVKNDPRRRYLGRRGKTGLTNGEDNDLALTSCDIGLGTGKSCRLKMTHIIPTFRMKEDYIIKLVEGTSFTNIILVALRGKSPDLSVPSFLRSLLGKFRRRISWNRRARLLFEARMRAKVRAAKVISSWS